MDKNICQICGNTKNFNSYMVKERMLGLNDSFEYLECKNCENLFIKKVPENLGKYYPLNYYSYRPFNKTSFLKKKLKKIRFQSCTKNKTILGNILKKIFDEPEIANWVKTLEINFDDKILDVGCGEGKILGEFANVGFKNLVGIDPYLSEELTSNDFTLYNKEIFDLDSKYDLIMFNHSFEHVIKPEEVLVKAVSLLEDEGTILIRVPIVGSYAWEEYKENWVQLDAPRHINLFSKRALEILAKKTNLKIISIKYDSTAFQFWGSIQYTKSISLNDSRSYIHGITNSIFTQKEIEKFKVDAKEFNSKGIGDQAIFYLKKIKN